ncbi:MAG: PDDEXK nuclease domain-containing protein [Verrucomicrobiota bacterium]|jgi:predicted nuclease of restriction endonuclease-like (RecB) superfamily|nr:PDDEXK nuclease domain-containing protein [Verrucomicrobiota bacterium]
MLINNKEYFETLEQIKKQIRNAQYRAVLGANREQIILYWNIGKVIVNNIQWGNKFIDNLAHDIKSEFQTIKGFSIRNLKYMRQFADFVTNEEIVQTLSAQLTWSHNVYLFDKAKSLSEYLWYAEKAIQNGWSLSSLEYHVGTKAYQRQALGEKATNYKSLLQKPQSNLAIETLKNPYVFDFVEQREGIIEREIEHELVANIAKTIMELGTGFAFYGSQYHLEISGKDYYIDLLFYNTRLHCFVVIELKNTDFRPEYAGKLNFYLSAVDDLLRHPEDNPSIGILLCKERDKLTAEYALRDINKPIGVSEYKLSDFVPEELANTLPSAEDIEKRIMGKYEIKEDDEGNDDE